MEPLQVLARLTIPALELQVSFARSGGPGGQNVNKVESKVILRYDVRGSRVLSEARRALLEERLASRLTAAGELVVQASEERGREANLQAARERMARILREALHVPKLRRATKPSRGSKERRLQAKKQKGERKRGRGSWSE